MAALDERHHARLGNAVIHQFTRNQLAVLVVYSLLVKGLAEALRDASMHLAVHDHGIDDVTDIVHGHVAFDVHLAGVGVDLRHHDVGTEGEREVWRLPEVRGHHTGFGLRRQLHGAVRRTGDLRQRDRLTRFVAGTGAA